ncbi:MAG: transcriptional regulator [Spirochaetales bacterium]|nr:transcriptional regulator [Spirochaetales bacterium]
MSKLNIENIDPIIHSKYRLAILALLAGGDEIDFNFFKRELDITDGNLSIHLKRLEEKSFITMKKQFVKRKPKTSYRITENGLQQYKQYLEEISKLFTL